jgi:hypothetical protein
VTVRRAQGRRLALCFLLFLTSACGAKRFTVPSGPGIPFPEYAMAFGQATDECARVKAMTATLGLSGRAGAQRVRGRIDAGFTGAGQARLEGRAPFGRPVFILVAPTDTSATLVLSRENRVLRDAPPAAIVEALTGVDLDTRELLRALLGCGIGAADPSRGRAYGRDWIAVDTDGATHYLRRVDGRWRIMASVRGPLTIENREFVSGRPSTITMRTTPAAGGTPRSGTDLTLRLSDVDINVPIDPDAFKLEIPAGADPLTLEELRRAGPLGGARIPNPSSPITNP